MNEENSTSPETQPEKAKDIKSKFSFQLKAIALLAIVALFFLILAVLSYSRSDIEESNISFFDLYGLINKSPDILALQATADNWLGLFGAYLSDKLINNTFGYPVLLLLISGIILSWSMFRHLKFTSESIRHTSFILLLMLFLSGFFGSLVTFTWLGQIPYEWSGSVGYFLASVLASVLGNIGAFFIFLLAIFFAVFYKMNFKISDIAKYIFSSAKNGFKKSEDSEIPVEEIQYAEGQDNSSLSSEQSTNFGYEIKTASVPGTSFNYGEPKRDPAKPEPHQNQPVHQGENPFSPSLKIMVNDPLQQSDTHANHTAQGNQPDKYVPTIKPIDPENVYISNPDMQKEVRGERSPDQNQPKSGIIPPPAGVKSVLLDSINDEQTSPDGTGQKGVTVNYNEQLKTEEAELKPLIYTDHSNYKLKFKPPTLDLLVKPSTQASVDRAELEFNAKVLQEKLETFKIEIANLTVTPGPVVTQFEFVPAPGIKISKIESLEDDLAMALKAKGIRIIAPIPGRGTIGVEVPNSNPQMVHFSDIVSTEKFRKSEAKLPLAFGKTINGDIFIEDLTKMPHLMIAGSTGSGKSVGINTIINSLLYKVPPSDLKFVIIDPKKVELPQYAALSQHYLASSPDVEDLIVSNPKDAVSILKSTVLEMENRYDILRDAMQRNISDYNRKLEDGTLRKSDKILHKKMPYIVVIIDELADLMLTASKEIEEPIARLAQMARAVGIHLVVATQRPSVDVITGVIKANFPARIAYLVAQKVDSRTILDQGGADQLLGNGDMLFLPPGMPKPVRIQNAFISTDEVERIVEFIGNQPGYPEPYMLPSWEEEVGEQGEWDPSNRDPLFEQAARLIINTGQASVSNLQRRMSVGYARAARIMDELEAAGIVASQRGSKPREILLDSESQLEAYL
jgi:S-DNA-T family DNA segregation ATPase FtsK/SpoIIIE